MPSPTLTPDPPAGAGALPSAELSRLRLVPVPGAWPPYDCETHGAVCPAARAAATPDTPASAGPADAATRAYAPPRATGRTVAGQATALPRQFAQVIVEILAGSRPLRQTCGWTTDRVRAQIGDLTQWLASDQRPKIRRIVTSQPAASVVEMTVVVNVGPRSRALAMRFDYMPARPVAPGLPPRPARWLCTEIEAP